MINSCDSQRRFDRVFIWAFIAAFCVSQLVILFSYSTVGDLAVESDFLAEIAPAAQRLEIGELRVEDYPFKGPVSALAIAVLHGFTGQMGMGLFRTGNLLSIISAIIVLWSVFGIGLCCWNRKTAVVGHEAGQQGGGNRVDSNITGEPAERIEVSSVGRDRVGRTAVVRKVGNKLADCFGGRHGALLSGSERACGCVHSRSIGEPVQVISDYYQTIYESECLAIGGCDGW